jgi:hypothetical protein
MFRSLTRRANPLASKTTAGGVLDAEVVLDPAAGEPVGAAEIEAALAVINHATARILKLG